VYCYRNAPEGRSGEHFWGQNGIPVLSCNQGGTLLLQCSGKYLPKDQILPVLKLNCVMQFALLNDAA